MSGKKITEREIRILNRLQNYEIIKEGVVSRCMYCLKPSRFHIKFCDDICKDLFEEEVYSLSSSKKLKGKKV